MNVMSISKYVTTMNIPQDGVHTHVASSSSSSKPLFGPQASCHSAAYDDWQHLPLCKHKTMLILLMLLLLMMLLLLLMLTLMLMLILLLN